MGLLYTVKRTNVTVANTTADILTIQSNATRSFRIKEVAFFGEGTTSVQFEIGIYRLTTIGTTTGGLQTAAPLNPAAPAFGGLVNNGWTTPSTAGVLIDSWGVNQNGGICRWKFAPGEEIEVPGGGGNVGVIWRATLAPTSGAIGMRALIEEF
jgi:hypothetical protein